MRRRLKWLRDWQALLACPPADRHPYSLRRVHREIRALVVELDAQGPTTWRDVIAR